MALLHTWVPTRAVMDEELTQLYATAPIGLALVDRDHRFVRVNERLAAIHGRSVADHLGRTIREVIPNIADVVGRHTTQVLETGEPQLNVEVRGRTPAHPDEDRRWMTSQYPVTKTDGTVSGVSIVVEDITDRSLATEALHQANAQMSTILNSTADGVVQIDSQGTIAAFNGTAERMFGYRAEEVLGQNVKMLMPEPYKAEHDAHLDRYARTGDRHILSVGRELEGRRKDGSTFPLGLRVNEVDSGQHVFIGTLQDLTLQKETEQALHETEEQYRILVEQSLVGVYLIQDYRYVYVNPKMAEIFGYTQEELLSLPNVTLGVVSTERERVQKQIRDRLEGKESISNYNFHARHRNGRLLELEVHGSRTELNGRPAIVGSMLDITERVDAERHFRQAEAELRQARKMETIGRLAGGVAHDFNNLLTIVVGHGDRLLRHLRPQDPLHRSASTIRHAASRATALTGQLLAFSRRQALKPTVLSPNEAVTEVEQLLPRLLGEDIQMEVALSPDVWSIRVDRDQLGQVLMNLAVNARDAMPDGGTIRIATTNVLLDRTSARKHAGMPAGPYVAITFSDTGHGMDEMTLAQVFEPFFTTKDHDKGTGLGLSTVYGVVTQSSGFVDVDSAPGHGTTFTIYFPQVEAAEQQAPPAISHEPPAYGTETVLLVEDEDDLREVLQEGLEALGYVVVTARNGKEALERCHQAAFDVVVTDVVMPEMNGRELSERLTVSFPELKTLYISGFTDDIIGQRGVSEGGPQLLRKPFSADELARKVQEVLHAGEQPSRQLEIDSRRGLVVMRPVGDISYRSIIASGAEVLQHPLYDASFDALIDLRGGRLRLTPEEVTALVDLLVTSGQTPPTRTAVLVDSPRETALVMLYSQRATFHSPQAFSTKEAAYTWLERDT